MAALPLWEDDEVNMAEGPYPNVSYIEAYLTEALLHHKPSPFSFSNVSLKADFFTSVINVMDIYITPVIILVGLFGNTLSFLVFSCSHLPRLSTGLYMYLLALSDIGYLLGLSIVWLARIDIRLFHTTGWCQGVLYVNHVCGFLSIWSVVSFTAERCVIVYHPLRKDIVCSRRHAKIALITLVVCACVLYSYIFYTQIVIYVGTKHVCAPDSSYSDLTTAMLGIDTFVACLTPSCIIIVLNVSLIKKIHDYQSLRSHDKRKPATEHSLPAAATTNTVRMLLVLSSINVLLNLPKHAVRLHFVFSDLFLKTTRFPKLEMELYQLFHMLYFLSFAVNFFVYNACSRPFRSGLMRLFRR